jgi:D-glycero-alpha-D-manno-heptose 1-phosphate guanylyltransferase
MNISGKQITAVLLVGGLGTRLRSLVPTAPKPLASIGERPFLELLVRQLQCQGIRHLVMCTGYRSDDIQLEFGDGHSRDLTIEYSRETRALGTAGPIRLARPYLRGARDFLVMNGDSFMETDFGQLIRFHRESGGLASMAVVRMKNEGRYGTVEVDSKDRVMAFLEKRSSTLMGLVNAGVYVFDQGVFEHIPEGPASLEKEVFPQLLAHGVYALEQRGVFIDIGTPEDYVRAQELYGSLYEAALREPGPGTSD